MYCSGSGMGDIVSTSSWGHRVYTPPLFLLPYAEILSNCECNTRLIPGNVFDFSISQVVYLFRCLLLKLWLTSTSSLSITKAIRDVFLLQDQHNRNCLATNLCIYQRYWWIVERGKRWTINKWLKYWKRVLSWIIITIHFSLKFCVECAGGLSSMFPIISHRGHRNVTYVLQWVEDWTFAPVCSMYTMKSNFLRTPYMLFFF